MAAPVSHRTIVIVASQTPSIPWCFCADSASEEVCVTNAIRVANAKPEIIFWNVNFIFISLPSDCVETIRPVEGRGCYEATIKLINRPKLCEKWDARGRHG